MTLGVSSAIIWSHSAALAEAEGESAVYGDLRQRLFVDPARLRVQFDA